MDRKLFPGLIILLMLISSCTSKTADKEDIARNDSIKKYLDLAAVETITLDKRIYYNDKALATISNSQNSSEKSELLYKVIANYHPLENWEKYRKAVNLYVKSLSSNDKKGFAQVYRSYGNYYYETKLLDSAFYFYTKAEKTYKGISDFDGCSTVLYKKGIMQYSINDFLAADLSFSKAYFYAKNINDDYKKYLILNQLGLNCNELGEFNNAINYFKSAIKVSKSESLKNKKYLDIICLSNIGLVYQNLKKHDFAISYFRSSLKSENLIKDFPEAYSNITDNLAYSRFKTNDYRQLPSLFFESLGIRNKKKDTSGIIISNRHLSEYYCKINQKQKALNYINESIRLSRLERNPIDLLYSLKQALRLDSINSSKYADEYLKIIDSLQLAERNSKVHFDRIQLTTDEITQEKEDAVKQKWIITATSGILILLIILVLIITRQRARQNELQLLQSQQKANEEIYNLMLSQKNAEDIARQQEKQRIAIELHDGVMNRLASTRLNLNILSYKKDDETIRTCMDSVTELYSIEKEIRHIAHDLNLENFNTDSFTSLLTDLVATQNNTTNTNYKLEIDEYINWIDVHASIKMNVYRIIQEACHNINKSAQADNTLISFILDEGNLCLSVTDDGKGFDVNKHSGGMGLKNMKLRVNNMGGKFVIQSRNKSTSLNISIPII